MDTLSIIITVLCVINAFVVAALFTVFVIVLPMVLEDRRDKRRHEEELQAMTFVDFRRFLSDYPEYKIFDHLPIINDNEELEVEIDDLLIEFDEMGYCPTSLCKDPEGEAKAWHGRLIAVIEKLKK